MLDPTEYDPDELRTLAGAAVEDDPDRPDWEGPVEFLGTGEARLQGAQLGELYFLSAAMGGSERPYLERVPNVVTGARLALDWLEFLLQVGGRAGAESALAYYRRVEWLSQAAHDQLTALLPGLAPGMDGGDVDRLRPGHHRTSLVFVARLAALR